MGIQNITKKLKGILKYYDVLGSCRQKKYEHSVSARIIHSHKMLCNNLSIMIALLLRLHTATYKLIEYYYLLRGKWFRLTRLLFPSPAEVRFIELMGGKVITFNFIKHHKTKFPLTITLHLGTALSRQNFKREVKVGKYWLDFGNDIKWSIEVDGRMYHRNVVKEFNKQEYLQGFCDRKCRKDCRRHLNQGWRVKHIEAARIFNEPNKVQREVLQFLYS